MLNFDTRDLACGAMLVAIGGFIAAYAYISLDIGTVQRMGSGMFPVAVGVMLSGFGVSIIIPAFFRSGNFALIEWRSSAAVLASLAAFAVLIRPFGLIPAIIALIAISTLAESRFRLLSTLVMCIAFPVFAYLVFGVGLGLSVVMFTVPF